MDCSPPGSSFHGILQARILEWAAIPFLTQGYKILLSLHQIWSKGKLTSGVGGPGNDKEIQLSQKHPRLGLMLYLTIS